MKRILCIALCTLLLFVPALTANAASTGDSIDLSEILTDYVPLRERDIAEFTLSLNRDFYEKLMNSEYLFDCVEIIYTESSAQNAMEIMNNQAEYGLADSDFAYILGRPVSFDSAQAAEGDYCGTMPSGGYSAQLAFSQEATEYIASLDELDRVNFISSFFMTLLNSEYVAAIEIDSVFYSGDNSAFVPTVIAGDANGDSQVNAKDSLLIKAYISGAVSKVLAQNADINHDGRITAIDSLLVKKQIAKIA